MFETHTLYFDNHAAISATLQVPDPVHGSVRLVIQPKRPIPRTCATVDFVRTAAPSFRRKVLLLKWRREARRIHPRNHTH